MVDNRCYEINNDWGKLGEGHSRLILDEIVSLPEGGEYNVLHIGCGNTYSPVPGRGPSNWPISFNGLLRSMYYTQFDEKTFPHPRTQEPYGILVKQVNYTLSDRFEKFDSYVQFRSKLAFFDQVSNSDKISGKQEYRQIYAQNTPYDEGEIDIVIAVGFFSKRVLRDVDLKKILSELSRILKHGGKLICSVHEHYVDYLINESKTIGFELGKNVVSKDLSPENSQNIGNRSLLILNNN